MKESRTTVDRGDTRMYHPGMKMSRQMIQFTAPQLVFLKEEAKRLGLSVAELVRRIVDEHRSKKEQPRD